MKYLLAPALFILSLCTAIPTEAQPFRTGAQQLVLSNEDSLHAGINSQKTVISGYGSAFYQRNFNQKQSTLTLERAVLFVGHQFSQKISFFSELEIENAKVAGGESDSCKKQPVRHIICTMAAHEV